MDQQPRPPNPVEELFKHLSPTERRKYLSAHDARRFGWPADMQPQTDLPADLVEGMFGVWRSRNYGAMAYPVPENTGVLCRLTVHSMLLNPVTGSWIGGISWDEMFKIKNQCGFAEMDAIEVYPALDKLINVSNMRHLWVLKQRVNFNL